MEDKEEKLIFIIFQSSDQQLNIPMICKNTEQFCSGVDPEVSPSGYGVAADVSQTPRSKQFTITLNVGF